MKIFTLVLIFLSFFIPSLAQDLDTVWTKRKFAVTCVKFTPDGKRIIGGYGNSILEYDALTGDTIRRFETWGEVGYIRSMELTKSGRYVFSTNEDGKTYGWEIESGKSLQDIGYHDVIKNDAYFCVHPYENKVYFCYGDTISLFNIENRKTESFKIIHGRIITKISVSKDNKYLALSAYYYDNSEEKYFQSLLLIDTKDYSIIAELKNKSSETLGIDFSYDSKYLAYLSSGSIVSIYDIEHSTTNRYYNGQFNFDMYSIKYIKEQNLLIVSGIDVFTKNGKTSVLDNITKKILYSLNYGGRQDCVDISTANQMIIQDNFTLALINPRWFTTAVPLDPRVVLNGNRKIKYMNEVLSLDNADSELIKLINIFDINGKLVKNYDSGYSDATVDLPFSAPAGVYLVRIVTDHSDYNFKFVRE